MSDTSICPQAGGEIQASSPSQELSPIFNVPSGVPTFNTTENHFDPNYRPKDDGSDNLRGFDPASENDMDDNGMTRYQENYGDEGWD